MRRAQKRQRERCFIAGCTNLEAWKGGKCPRPTKGGLCEGHAYRKAHGLPLDVELRRSLPPLSRFIEAAVALGGADTGKPSDSEFRRLVRRLVRAGRKYFASLKRS